MLENLALGTLEERFDLQVKRQLISSDIAAYYDAPVYCYRLVYSNNTHVSKCCAFLMLFIKCCTKKELK